MNYKILEEIRCNLYRMEAFFDSGNRFLLQNNSFKFSQIL